MIFTSAGEMREERCLLAEVVEMDVEFGWETSTELQK